MDDDAQEPSATQEVEIFCCWTDGTWQTYMINVAASLNIEDEAALLAACEGCVATACPEAAELAVLGVYHVPPDEEPEEE